MSAVRADSSPVTPAVQVAPIREDDVHEVARFLHATLNDKVSVEAWVRTIVPPWEVQAPNHGFLLRAQGRVVGAYLALYSDRVVEGTARRFCNLAAWCVEEPFRAQGFRLARALLRQPGYEFTDLSPSGNVVELNRRLGFDTLDTTTALVPNLPIPGGAHGTRLVSQPDELERTLDGSSLRVYRDHRHPSGVIHLGLQNRDGTCYVIARKERRKGLPLFASIVHVSDQKVFQRGAASVYRHLLLRHGALMTLAELRVVGGRPSFSMLQREPRPRMFRSRELPASAIDYLYSEVTCVSW
jgi:hypothetical protein